MSADQQEEDPETEDQDPEALEDMEEDHRIILFG